MSEARDFFRICPSCGRRFHIRLVDRKLVGDRRRVEEIKKVVGTPMAGMYGQSLIVGEADVPITVDVKDFQYSYKCKQCGHAWTEIREKESKA